MERRRFLEGALALGGIAAASSAGLVVPAGAAPALGPRNDFADLARRLTGRLLLPGGARYRSDRLLFNAVYDYVRPAAIAQVADVDDVRTVIDFAVDNDIELVGRCGGHSFAGLSTGPGLVLDVSSIKRVTPDLGANTTTVGAGARLIDVAAALRRTERAIPSGSCPSVGISGLTLGGGIGNLTRKYGLTSDSVRALELVTADGQVLRASEHEHADLFWACRGGGGGNFGIVTEFEFELRPVDFAFSRFELTWPWEQRARAFAAWQEWSVEAPAGTTGTFTFTTGGPRVRTPGVTVEGVFMGDPDDGAAFVADLERRVGTRPVDHQSVVTDYFHGEKDEFCDDLPLAECRPAYQSPQGKLPRLALSIKSDFVTTAWSDDAVAVISEWIERRQRDSLMTRAPSSMNLGKVFLQTMGGAAGDVPADATAFPHRSAEFSVQFQSRWSIDAPVDVREANIEWLRGFYAAMTPWRSGSAYVNYTDVDLVDWPRAYYGPNLDRLLAVKRTFDPRNVFHSRQSIPVTA